MGVCLYTGFWVKLIEPDLEVLTKLVLYIYVPMQRLELSLRAFMHKQQQLRKITYAQWGRPLSCAVHSPQPTGNLVDAARRCVILSKVSKAALTNCYRTLSRFVHTDKNIENPEATRAFQKLREAMSAVFCSVSELHTYIHTYICHTYIHTYSRHTYICK